MLESTRIKTEIPGPKSRELMERRYKAVSSGVGIATPMFAKEAKGALLTDVDGNTFIDFGGGIGVLNVGHADSRVVDAVKEQADRLTHTCFYVTEYEGYLELAEKLNALVPGDTEKRSFFVNSGAEAVENAVKFAKLATGRSAVICFDRAFHGRTQMAMSLTSKQHPYKAGLGPFVPEVYRAPYPYPYRDDVADPAEHALDALRDMFVTHVAAENVAAIIFEPVQGEGGFVVPPAEWVQGLRQIADEHGIVLIADEVQSGMGRTGRMFAIEHFGVEPDLITIAKSMAAGVPISGVLGKAAVIDAAGDSTIGGTYVGSPLGCVAGIAVLDEIEQRDLLGRGRAIGERMRARFEAVQARHPRLGDVRGLGPMLAVEFVRDPATRTPTPEVATAVAEAAMHRGLLILKAGIYGNCLRVLVSLVATDAQIDESLDVFDEAVDSVLAETPAMRATGR
jgi:4-aminobutyrate aminotransferase / (S)-3-amino-2-methylpropionate transaminase / 5-aminovalerate transaminase